MKANFQSVLRQRLAASVLATSACAAAPAPRSSGTPAAAARSAAAPDSSTGAPAGPVKDCSACGAVACVSVAGLNYCAKPVDLASAADMEAHVGSVVSLRTAELGNAGGPCPLAVCDCCNSCAGGSMFFRSSIGVAFKRGGQQLPLPVKPLKDQL